MKKEPIALFDMVEALPSLAEEKIIKKERDKENDDPWKYAEAKESPGNLDIKVEMRAADLRNTEFYNNLPPSQQKQISPLVLMRWFSCIPDSSPHLYPTLVGMNEILNKNFWNLSKHVGLQWKLMALCGPGVTLNHGWLNMTARRAKISKLSEYMLRWYPHANDYELKLLTWKLTRDEFEQFVKSTGASDQELKDTLKIFDEERGTKAKKASKKIKD